jgi:hypothetical protein
VHSLRKCTLFFLIEKIAWWAIYGAQDVKAQLARCARDVKAELVRADPSQVHIKCKNFIFYMEGWGDRVCRAPKWETPSPYPSRVPYDS